MSYSPKLAPLPGLEQCIRLTTFYSSPAAGEVISQDIDPLRQNIDNINVLFDKVMRPLQRFDHEYYSKSSDGGSALAPQWAVFRTRFNKYVDSSRDSATAASRIMRLYAEAVLGKVGQTNCDVQALVSEIKIFQAKVQEHVSAAEAVRDNFGQIAKDILDFKHRVELTVNLKNVSAPLSEDMTKAFENIEVLHEKVTSVPDELLDKESTYLAMVAALNPRVAKVLSMLSPTAAIQALQLIFGTPDRTPAQSELANGSTLHDIGSVAQRIEAIANIWHNLRVDLISLETDLSLCAGDQNVSNSLFLMPKIEFSRAVVVRLTECLDLYVRRVPPKSG